MQAWLPVDTVSINGRTGIRDCIAGARHNPGAVPLVISQDPSLAALASGYRRVAAMQETSFPGSPERISFREVMSEGAPLEIYGMQLVSVSTAAVPSARFRIPAEPVAAARVRQHAEAVRAATVSASTPTAVGTEADEQLAWEARRLRNMIAAVGPSLGDRFCLALAKRLGSTADRAWREIAGDAGAKVVVVR